MWLREASPVDLCWAGSVFSRLWEGKPGAERRQWSFMGFTPREVTLNVRVGQLSISEQLVCVLYLQSNTEISLDLLWRSLESCEPDPLFHHDCAEMCFNILSNSWHVLRQCWGVKKCWTLFYPDTSYFLHVTRGFIMVCFDHITHKHSFTAQSKPFIPETCFIRLCWV